MQEIILALIFSFAAPLPLLLIESYLPFPALIEEAVAFALILIVLHAKVDKRCRLPAVLMMGILFSLSETFFYLVNYLYLGATQLLFWRLLLTDTMHITTFLVIYMFARRGKFWGILGLLCAIAIHFGFNTLVSK